PTPHASPLPLHDALPISYASRALVTSGNAIHRAATAVRDKALRLAASLLEVPPHDLELADGRARVRGAPGRELTLGALATVANPDRKSTRLNSSHDQISY